jgi:hypothetical protein
MALYAPIAMFIHLLFNFNSAVAETTAFVVWNLDLMHLNERAYGDLELSHGCNTFQKLRDVLVYYLK